MASSTRLLPPSGEAACLLCKDCPLPCPASLVIWGPLGGRHPPWWVMTIPTHTPIHVVLLRVQGLITSVCSLFVPSLSFWDSGP